MANAEEDAAQNGLQSGSSLPATLGAVSVKTSPFWKPNPELWFFNLGAQFELANITQDKTKYFIVVSALDSDIMRVVSDVVCNPPADNKYKHLKEMLISRLSGSENQKIKQLLTDMTLGDGQPSQLLREMQTMNQGRLSDDMLKSLWLQRLSANMQAILSCNLRPLRPLNFVQSGTLL